jgi:hypothetical protein
MVTIHSQEFETLLSCEMAKKKLIELLTEQGKVTLVSATCVKK